MGSLDVFVVYGPENPSYPGLYVVHRQVVEGGRVVVDRKPQGWATSLADARRLIPWGKSWIDRYPEDHESIVECWL